MEGQRPQEFGDSLPPDTRFLLIAGQTAHLAPGSLIAWVPCCDIERPGLYLACFGDAVQLRQCRILENGQLVDIDGRDARPVTRESFRHIVRGRVVGVLLPTIDAWSDPTRVLRSHSSRPQSGS
jgi:hypothetical protein